MDGTGQRICLRRAAVAEAQVLRSALVPAPTSTAWQFRAVGQRWRRVRQLVRNGEAQPHGAVLGSNRGYAATVGFRWPVPRGHQALVGVEGNT